MKLSSTEKQFDDFQGSSKNIIISTQTLTLKSMFSKVLCKCGGSVMQSEDVLSRSVLANRLCLSCDECCNEEYFWTSELCNPKPSTVLPNQRFFEVNSRFFYGLRCIGKGGSRQGKCFVQC